MTAFRIEALAQNFRGPVRTALVDALLRKYSVRRSRARWWSHQLIRMVAGIPKLVIRFSALHPIFASTC